MEYRKFNDRYYIRLDRGDEILSELAELCTREGVRAASVQGIGGCERAVVGVFDLGSRTYRRQEVCTMLELISLDGNATEYEGKPYLHLHASFAYHDENDRPQVLTGHLLEAVIGLTGEIILTPADGVVTRRYDEELGIRVWSFE